jgi:hypothetical protein
MQRVPVLGAVLISSAPPQGVFALSWNFVKSNLPMVNPLSPRAVPRLMTLEEFKFAFCNEYSNELTLQM